MSWILTDFEERMKQLFHEKLGTTKGDELFTDYSSLRNDLVKDNFFAEIKGAEPNLSDHSAKHIKDVLNRAYKIIGDKGFEYFNVYEIYCLALMILFHDVGNIFGRKGHESIEKISEVYNKYRNNLSNYRAERRVVTQGASAHSGTNKEGGNDTLLYIKDSELKGEKIRLKELASILRFSDELAEGQQRTCSFAIEKKLYEEGSEVFHLYAQCTSIGIDRKLERVSITYDIDIEQPFDEENEDKIKKLILFTYYRALKLDIERRYTKSHSEILKIFRSVSVQYNFTYNDLPIDLDLSGIEFLDKYPIPGETISVKDKKNLEGSIKEKNPDYAIDKLMSNIKSKIN